MCGAASGNSDEHKLKQCLQHREENLGFSTLLIYGTFCLSLTALFFFSVLYTQKTGH